MYICMFLCMYVCMYICMMYVFLHIIHTCLSSTHLSIDRFIPRIAWAAPAATTSDRFPLHETEKRSCIGYVRSVRGLLRIYLRGRRCFRSGQVASAHTLQPLGILLKFPIEYMDSEVIYLHETIELANERQIHTKRNESER